MTTMTRESQYSHRCGIALVAANDGAACASEIDANSIDRVRRNNSNGNGTGNNITCSGTHLTLFVEC